MASEKFTDDDLKELKSGHHVKAYGCSVDENGDHMGSVDVLSAEKFIALISRLEAAEAIVRVVLPPAEVWHPRLVEAWRKAAGK